MKFVIIGGDAAGMSAASRTKRRQPDTEVMVLEQTGDVSYSACGMPYNIADPTREMDDLIVRHPRVFREKQGIDLRTGHRVEAIDPVQKTVRGTTSGGKFFQVPYDKLLIATGASAIIPGLPGFDLPGVMGLKTLRTAGESSVSWLITRPERSSSSEWDISPWRCVRPSVPGSWT